MKDEEKRLIALLRAEIDPDSRVDTRWQELSEEEQRAVIKCASKHDVAALAADYVLREKSTENKDIYAELKEQYHKSQRNYVRQLQAQKKCTDVFQSEEIPFIVLKGAVLRPLYPKPWLRTSADIDILVSREHYERATALLKNRSGFEQKNETPHDTAFRLSEGAYIEVHHQLMEREWIGEAKKQLDDVWQTASPASGFEYVMSDEMFYFYHLAHMAKHIERGGCGIRPFIDLWLLNHRTEPNPRREELLNKGGLKQFADAAVLLSEHWFGRAQADENTALFEAFVLQGGVFGNKKNEVMAKSANMNGSLGYLMYKVWMPYPFLCIQYPSLKGKRVLQPFYEMRRWMRIIFRGNIRYGTQEVKLVSQLSPQMEDTAKMWRYLGF